MVESPEEPDKSETIDQQQQFIFHSTPEPEIEIQMTSPKMLVDARVLTHPQTPPCNNNRRKRKGRAYRAMRGPVRLDRPLVAPPGNSGPSQSVLTELLAKGGPANHGCIRP